MLLKIGLTVVCAAWFSAIAMWARHGVGSRILWFVIGIATFVMLQAAPTRSFFGFGHSILSLFPVEHWNDRDAIMVMFYFATCVMFVMGGPLFLFLRRTRSGPAAVIGVLLTGAMFVAMYASRDSHR